MEYLLAQQAARFAARENARTTSVDGDDLLESLRGAASIALFHDVKLCSNETPSGFRRPKKRNAVGFPAAQQRIVE